MVEVVLQTLDPFSINAQTVGYFVLDNASNNDIAVIVISQKLGFRASDRRYCCGPHTLNLVSQRLL